jgi:N6-L-threonylcarbamoyladenine synthase
MNILGIETSCDETAAAVVADGRLVRSGVVLSQIARHRPFGGVVPELASRCHVEALPEILRQAVADAGLSWAEIDRLAVTSGPGLASALLVGVVAAKSLSLALGRPLVAVHHLEAHFHSVFLCDDPPAPSPAAPLLALLVSGGHTALILSTGAGTYRMLGQTFDDAAGEALDKGAKLLRLGYPGGPAIERAAAGGDAHGVNFPRGAVSSAPSGMPVGLDPGCCFSFSGLKTALLYHLRGHPEALEGAALRDVAASYQEAVVDALLERVERAVRRHRPAAVACAGGVARNARLRERLEAFGRREGLRVIPARPEYCTDNAVMIAAAAGAGLGRVCDDPAELDVSPSCPMAAP